MKYLLAFLLLLPAAVHADQTFAGPHAAQERALVAGLPAVIRHVTITVVELSDQECADEGWPWDAKRRAGVVGEAFKEEKRIELRTSEWAPSYFIHEVGHQVWWQLLSAGNRCDWYDFWKAHKAEMNRSYARTSSIEGFAESFAMAYLPRHLKGDADLGDTTAEVKQKTRSLAEGGELNVSVLEPPEES